MTRRVLVMRAGGGPSNNLIRSLRTGDPSLVVLGCHADRFALAKSTAERNHLIPELAHPNFLAGLSEVIERERVDLLVPNNDDDVRTVSGVRDRLPCRAFLPRPEVIERCQDKYELTAFLRACGVPAPLTHPVTDVAWVDDLFRRLAPRPKLWCRVRRGAGSMAAIPVTRPEQARAWIAYWEELRGVPAGSFTLSEYLPGRDFAVQGLWHAGRLVLLKTCERLAYFGGGSQPSGVSSTPALGKLVHEPRVAEVCRDALRHLDPDACGVFSIDLKEDADGVPCVTEINAGRFCMITNVFDLTGRHNMAVTYVRLALEEPVAIRDPFEPAGEWYLVRDLDTLPGIFHVDELFEGRGHDLHRRKDDPLQGALHRPPEVEERAGPEDGAGALQQGAAGARQEVPGVRHADEVTGDDGAERLEITGELDRRAIEALQLEIRRLAERYGVAVDEMRIEPVADEPG